MNSSMKYARKDSNRIVALESPFPVTIFANEDVHIEKAAFAELGELANLNESLERLYDAAPEIFAGRPAVEYFIMKAQQDTRELECL